MCLFQSCKRRHVSLSMLYDGVLGVTDLVFEQAKPCRCCQGALGRSLIWQCSRLQTCATTPHTPWLQTGMALRFQHSCLSPLSSILWRGPVSVRGWPMPCAVVLSVSCTLCVASAFHIAFLVGSGLAPVGSRALPCRASNFCFQCVCCCFEEHLHLLCWACPWRMQAGHLR